MDRDRTLAELIAADRLNQPLKPYERFRLEDAREKGKVQDSVRATDFVASHLHAKPVDPRVVHQKKQIDQKKAVAGWQNAASKAKIKGISGAPMEAPDRNEDENVSLDGASVEVISAPLVNDFAENREAIEEANALEERQMAAACAASLATAIAKDKENRDSRDEDAAEPNVRFEIRECIYIKSFWTPEMEKYVWLDKKYYMSGALNAKYTSMVKRLPKIYTGGSEDGDDDSDDSDESSEQDYELSDAGSVNVDAMSTLKEKGSSSSFSGRLSYQAEDEEYDDSDDDSNDYEFDDENKDDDDVDGGVKLIDFDP